MKWDKGNAAIYILKTAFGIHWSDNIRVIFAGDDLTDEDAMKALKVRKINNFDCLNLIFIIKKTNSNSLLNLTIVVHREWHFLSV